MTDGLRLIPTVDSAELSECFYIFDREAMSSNVIFVPTQKVTRAMHAVVQKIKAAWPPSEFNSIEAIHGLFDDPADVKRVNTLLASGYLETGGVNADADAFNKDLEKTSATASMSTILERQAEHFRTNVFKHYLKKPAFFNLPADLPDSKVDVGLVGLPVSTVIESLGTIYGPDRMRQQSQSAGFWFDLAKDGVYTEVGCEGTAPRIICKDVMLKDYGDIGGECRTVGDLFSDIRDLLDTTIFPNNIRPIFIGGDHAITFPVVDAFVQQYPSLVLVHLDAHNDLFYTRRVSFNHAGPMHGLLVQSNLKCMHSFGLRTTADQRVQAFNTLTDTDEKAQFINERVKMHSIGAFLRLLNNPEKLRQYFIDEIGVDTPCYLTIDLDVLSESAMDRQLSTPAGQGIEIFHLLDFIHSVGETLNLVGADIVEYSVSGDVSDGRLKRDMTTVLMHLTDTIYRSGQRNNKQTHTDVAAAPLSSESTRKPTSKPASSSAKAQLSLPAPARATQPKMRMVDIPRRSVEDLSYGDFFSEHVMTGTPVILTDFDLTDGFARWNFDYFIERVSSQQPIEVKVFPECFDHNKAYLRSENLSEMLKLMRDRERLDLAEHDERYNIVDWRYRISNPELIKDIPMHPFFDMDVSSHITRNINALKWIYFGEAGTGTPTHIDVMNSSAWLHLAYGRKAWRMVHADQRAQCSSRSGLVDLFDPDYNNYPDIDGLSVWQAEQLPGELVWTPPRCVHAVRNIEHSIGVTHNYVDLTNIVFLMDEFLDRYPEMATENDDQATLNDLVQLAANNMRRSGFESQRDMLLPRVASLLRTKRQNAQDQSEQIGLAIEGLTQPLAEVN